MTRKERRAAFYKLILTEVVILFLLIGIYLLIFGGKTYKKVYFEAGTSAPVAADFIKNPAKYDGSLVNSTVDMSSVGTYMVTIEINGKSYKSKAIVQDTVKPQALPADDVYVLTNTTPDPIIFVKDIKDATVVNATFKKEYNFTKLGEMTVDIILTDRGGNEVLVSVPCTVTDDITPPVIAGVQDMTVCIGDTIQYRENVSVSDDKDPDVTLNIDSSQVNVKELGTYPVTYKAVDKAGNETIATCNITITEPADGVINEDTVNYYAKQVLKDIVNDNMSDAQKAFAIYNWTRSNIAYVNTSDKSDWLKGAYQGFKTRSGDCFIYYATAKAMLDACGIENVDIVKSDTSHSQHFWSLVDLGTGYYHFDATPRVGSGDFFFMVTDEQLNNYSVQHRNSHIFDSSLYPERAKDKFDIPYEY